MVGAAVGELYGERARIVGKNQRLQLVAGALASAEGPGFAVVMGDPDVDGDDEWLRDAVKQAAPSLGQAFTG